MPLDLTVFKSFKSNISRESQAWKKSHEKRIDIYDIPAITAAAWMASFNPSNIVAGFEKAGIYPYAPHKFDHEFVSTEGSLTSNQSSTDTTDLSPNRSAQSVSQSPPEGISAAHQSTNEDPQACCPDQQNTIPAILQQKQDAIWTETRETLDHFLSSHGLIRIKIPGDGHCMVSSLSMSLRSSGMAIDSKEAVIRRLQNEINVNSRFYNQLPDDVDADIRAYIENKVYTSDMADLVLYALSNAYGVTTTIIAINPVTMTCSIVNQGPRREVALKEPRTIFLIRTGADEATHYDAVANLADYKYSPAGALPLQSTPPAPNPTERHAHSHLQADIPLPVSAMTRKRNSKRAKPSQILTDTPVKEEIERKAKGKEQRLEIRENKRRAVAEEKLQRASKDGWSLTKSNIQYENASGSQ